MPHDADFDLTAEDLSHLTSPDAVAAFLHRLGYPTDVRKELTSTSLGLAGETADAVRSIELLAEDEEGFFRVVFFKVRSITAKTRNDLARNLGKRNVDHLLVLASDFEVIEFVLIDKRTRQQNAPGGGARVQIIPRTVSIVRRASTQLDRRILRRLTWTGKDGLDQFDKLRHLFEAAAYTGQYFQNRALFADHYLETRLRESDAWRENPSQKFLGVRDIMRDCRSRWSGQTESKLRAELYDPIWKLLGFSAKVNRPANKDHLEPDYVLRDNKGQAATVAFVYRWDRWLDGPDLNDPETPEENPGAAVISALQRGDAGWIIVTNGKLWRLYSRDAHSRSTNFYEVDLEEALLASGETDPNEAFRYWWLFFRAEAFVTTGEGDQATCWLDTVVQGSRDYAKNLGERLKARIFEDIFPHLSQGFLVDRRKRLGLARQPSEDDLRDTYEATLTLLYRLLFLLYAESRDLLPIRESSYHEASLKKIKTEIAEKAGVAEGHVGDKLGKAYSDKETTLYDRLSRLFTVMDKGDSLLNVPEYNGGLFITKPDDKSTRREHRIGRFLLEHKVPDRYLTLAIDRLARDPDEKTCGLVFIDYKSLEVRHLGSIYEGLLEFKLKVAEEDLATVMEKKREKYIPLSEANVGRSRRAAEAVVRKGEIYLSNDKAERKASGSYYTPDPIVEYIVEHTVGPVLTAKLEALTPEFRKTGKTFHRHLENVNSNSALLPKGDDPRSFAADKAYAEHKDLVERLFDFKVLDPAMGSGHFLVEAVDFLTDRILDFLNRFPNNPVSFALDRTRNSILEALVDQKVTVDPDKLTDIHLLKRHVLKRCIYGVDLNPMAVELAKVSLWLDAFTLGAPLSFLDHHLRCGNSLVGATFKDLETATTGQLFSINYEPLLRAIRHVLFVNQMADATAAEVHQSASEYDRARRELSGYQIVLDLLVADHFIESGTGISPAKGKAKAKGASQPFRSSSLLMHAQELDLATREAFLKSLHDEKERTLVEQVMALARQSDRRFFHWELEFPEVFFGFADPDQRRISHRDKLAAGTAGFEAIVGNPPYVRQESIKEFKTFLRSHYTTFESTNDLYIYFQELEVGKLKTGGRMGMIVANKWMRAGYGEKLRGFLQRTAQPLQMIDFGHSPIFPDADTFPCIPIVARRTQTLTLADAVANEEEMLVCAVPRENWDERMNLGEFVRRRRSAVPVRLLRDEGWSLEDPRVQTLLEKIRHEGMSLKALCGHSPLVGIKTACNEAYIVTQETRSRMIREHKHAEALVRPLLRGRDIDRWRPRTSGEYLILIPSSENHDWPWAKMTGEKAETAFKKAFPSIYAHFLPLKEELCKRQDQGRFWWELRSCDYMEALQGPKILYQEIQFHSWFSLETDSSVINNKVFLLPSRDLALLGVLGSPLMWWYLTRTLPHMKDEALCPAGFMMENTPICTGTAVQAGRIREAVEPLVDLAEQSHDWEQKALETATQRFELESADNRLLGWLALPVETFINRMTKLNDRKHTRPALTDALADFQRKERGRQIAMLARQLEIERRLAGLVEDAYDLTPEERQLLHSTRPVRDPIDVLEARIRGKAVEVDEPDE